jgi:hypothetical protein
MTAQRVFGRRNAVPSQNMARVQESVREITPAPRAIVEQPAASSLPPPDHPVARQFDEELRQWKRARRQAYKIPWRQLILMASLCFGIAAFVLPDTISSTLDWLLYGMMAVGFYAGLRQRRSTR